MKRELRNLNLAFLEDHKAEQMSPSMPCPGFGGKDYPMIRAPKKVTELWASITCFKSLICEKLRVVRRQNSEN